MHTLLDLDPPRLRMHEIYLQAEHNRLKTKRNAVSEDERIAKIALKVVEEAMKRMAISSGGKECPPSVAAEHPAQKESQLYRDLLERVKILEKETAAAKLSVSAVEELVNCKQKANTSWSSQIGEQIHELLSSQNKNNCSIEQLQEAELRRQKESFTLSSLVVFKEEFQEQHGMIQKKIQMLQRLVEEHVKAGSEEAKLTEDLRSLEQCMNDLQQESENTRNYIKHIEQSVTCMSENMEKSVAQERRYGALLDKILSSLNSQQTA
mmetsp:Transcript_5874/g.36424  ORF Transcript_5874/g.36424 Transcript_5874/m.36424 type:complete len:265 (+) Transcript_5874:1593-2387(+)